MLLDITAQLHQEHLADIARAKTMEPFDQEFMDWVLQSETKMIVHGMYDDLNLGNSLHDIFGRSFVEDYANDLPVNREFKSTQVNDPDHFYQFSEYLFAYGVVDSIEQLQDLIKPIIECPDRNFVVSLCRVDREHQYEEGGWRWHKWGPYYGNHEPKHEYLYDEVDANGVGIIDTVIIFHVYEILSYETVIAKQDAMIKDHMIKCHRNGQHTDIEFDNLTRGNTLYVVENNRIKRFRLNTVETLNEYWLGFGDARGNKLYLVIGYAGSKEKVSTVFFNRKVAKEFVRNHKRPYKGY